MATKSFGPDVILPDDLEKADLWAEISATDDSGVTVQGVKAGDTVRIESVAGICSFSKREGFRRILSVIGIVGGIASGGKALFAAQQVEDFGKELKKQAGAIKEQVGNAAMGAKRRDGYGYDPGDNRFAEREGGLIVCMPICRGPIYSSDDFRLVFGNSEDKKGRLPEHYARLQQKCFFPCREQGGRMSMRSQTAGTLYILAFDSDYSDNSGSYELRFQVIRSNEPEAPA